jgi:hypothetical protein
MKNVCGWISGALFCILTPHAMAEVSCECPKLGCDPCSVQQSVKFYTDKCGPDNGKLKSCARPLCVPVENPTEACPVPPAANSGPREPIVVKAVATEAEPEAENAAGVGKVKVIQGSVSIVHKDGKKTTVTKDTELAENDTVETAADGAAVVHFDGGNKVHVHPDTAVEVKEFKDSKVEASRRALLYLIKGKIRNQVEQKYNGKTSFYRVQTKSAVAGVRGTDFVVEQTEGSDLKTTIETLKGRVILSDLDEKETREINKGEGASFVSELNNPKKGKLSPVYKIDAEHLKELDNESRVDVAKRKKTKDGAICKDPKGLYNQCSWHMNKGTCVRQRCNGNGEWAEDTHLSKPEAATACPATGYQVKDCDY